MLDKKKSQTPLAFMKLLLSNSCKKLINGNVLKNGLLIL